TALLAGAPEKDRKVIEERLRYWDSLPPSIRQELQNHQALKTYLTMPPLPDKFVSSAELPPDPEPQRRRIVDALNLYFEFRPEEQQKILSPLPEPERQQIEKTLEKFAALSPEQRSVCIGSFEKFTSMGPEERQQFLKKAERWMLMTPSE